MLYNEFNKYFFVFTSIHDDCSEEHEQNREAYLRNLCENKNINFEYLFLEIELILDSMNDYMEEIGAYEDHYEYENPEAYINFDKEYIESLCAFKHLLQRVKHYQDNDKPFINTKEFYDN